MAYVKKADRESTEDQTESETKPDPGDVQQMPSRKKIREADIHSAESVGGRYWVFPAIDTTREDILNPAYWSHGSPKLRAPAHLHVMPKGSAWYGEYLLLYVDRTQAFLKELSYHELSKVDPAIDKTGRYRVEFNPAEQFKAVRQEDNVTMQTGFRRQEDAMAWIVAQAQAA